MKGIGPIIIVAFFAIVFFMMLMGRKVRFYCRDCLHSWKGVKHHKHTTPRCPKCGSSNVGR